MKKDNTILIIAGLAAIGAGYYFYMKSKKPGYTITVPAPEKITATQYYAQTQQPIQTGPSIVESIFSIFKKKKPVSNPTNVYATGYGISAINNETSNFF